MLYKKIHRQHLRDFQEGKVLYSKPYIGISTISIMINEGEYYSYWDLIDILGPYEGRIQITRNPMLMLKVVNRRDDEDRNDISRVERLRCYIRKFIDNTLESLKNFGKKLKGFIVNRI